MKVVARPGYVKAAKCSECNGLVRIFSRETISKPCECGKLILYHGVLYAQGPSDPSHPYLVTLLEMFEYGDD